MVPVVFQVDKLYNEKDETFDPRERDEEIARMREHVMTEVHNQMFHAFHITISE